MPHNHKIKPGVYLFDGTIQTTGEIVSAKGQKAVLFKEDLKVVNSQQSAQLQQCKWSKKTEETQLKRMIFKFTHVPKCVSSKIEKESDIVTKTVCVQSDTEEICVDLQGLKDDD